MSGTAEIFGTEIITEQPYTVVGIRQHAEDSQSKGPRVLLLGSEDAGKTSLAKILLGYSVRQGRTPVLVGLDPKDVTFPLLN